MHATISKVTYRLDIIHTMAPVNLLFSHLILIIILLVSLIIILGSSSVRSYILTKKWILRAIIFALIIELISSIWIVREVKPALQIQAKVYPFSFKYRDYSQDWIDSLPTAKEKLCIENYLNQSTDIDRNGKCKDPVDAYIRQAEVFDQIGTGIAYLECDTREGKCNGLAFYQFPETTPKERTPVIIKINTKFSNNNKILTFSFHQEPTYIDIGQDNNIRFIKRPGIKFEITAERKGNKGEFKGDFKHPTKGILLAEFSVCISHECRE